MLYYALGFVLKAEDYRENDKLVDIYTDRFGKIEVIVRGAKRVISKLAGKCQPFILLYLTVSPGHFWWHLASLETSRGFYGIWQDLTKLKVGSKILMSVDSFVRPGKKDQRLFRLIFDAFAALDSTSSAKSKIILICFLIKMVSLLGYQPNLETCLFCRENKVDKLGFFHLAKGGAICKNCQAKFGGGLPITQEALKFLSQALKDKFSFWSGVSLPKNGVVDEAEKIINQFIIWHLQ
jgi:DNA repair protein RecO (recombination protein O)